MFKQQSWSNTKLQRQVRQLTHNVERLRKELEQQKRKFEEYRQDVRYEMYRQACIANGDYPDY
jgi:hypothetical protein